MVLTVAVFHSFIGEQRIRQLQTTNPNFDLKDKSGLLIKYSGKVDVVFNKV